MKVGQKVICIEQPVIDVDGVSYSPKVNDIVTVAGNSTMYPAIFLKEYPPINNRAHSYDKSCFRPLKSVLNEIGIEEIKQCLTREFQEK